jgi:hypothetical protein
MAEREQHREDLLAEATALAQRISLQLPGDREATIIGFRRDESASFYFGAVRAYHFTSTGELRRAFVGERLYKAQRGNLVAMRRRRKANVVELVSRALGTDEERRFVDETRSHLDRLKQALASGSLAVVGQVPKQADVLGRVRDWLARFGGSVTIAQSPRAS